MRRLLLRRLTGGSFLVAALAFSSLLNFVFNAFLGRILTFDEFGVVTLVNTLWYFLSMIFNALTYTVNQRVSFLEIKGGRSAAEEFTRSIFKKGLTVALIFCAIWLALMPLANNFFQLNGYLILLSFTPVIIFGLVVAITKGYLQGQLFFVWMAFATLVEPVIKLITVILLNLLRLNSWAYLSIPLSILFSFAVSFLLLSRKMKVFGEVKKLPFPRRLFTASILTTISTTIFLSLDVLLAKHFLSPVEAGQYSLLSLIGKIVFFFGTLLNPFIFTYAGRDLASEVDPNIRFYKFLAVSIGLIALAYLLLGPFGFVFVPILLGTKAYSVLPLLPAYSLAIALFTVSGLFVMYHLARQHFTFSILAALMTVSMCLGIFWQHGSISQIVNVLLKISFFYLALVIGLHLLKRRGKFILRNVIDLVDVFSKFPDHGPGDKGKRILIFNWRDTKHNFAGGAEVYIHELSKRWVKKGYKVTLFCGNDGNSKREEMVDGVEVIRRGGFYFVYIWAFYYYLFRFRGKYDVIIDCQNGIPFFSPLYAKEKVYCLMFHVHQEVFNKSLSKSLAFTASILENRVMPWAYKRTQFITISSSTKKDMKGLDIGRAGITIVYPGIDLSKFRPYKKNKKPLILYVGRLQFYKSVDVFIKAAKKVLQEEPDVEFIIAGGGEEEENLMTLTKKLNLTGNIKFLGKVSEEKKIDLYQRAWVFVNTSFKEGWGITTIEANACGTPVVASDVPGLRDSVKNPHTGFLVEYGNEKAFAQAITKILRNREIRQKMEKNSVEWAKYFDWEKSSKKSLDVIL